ncbi:TetR/AcrR family transcriptional regulator [Nonomuraea sp. MG754425]|uniref:TetR/AcrR family transcriptional regulator n=1 Tax=Nonomuraea sp. MG754425 TaxID=2570319 RepID=UPI001F2BA9B0|nr:TetR/AcrR family transcriptional regulator [Nonomuraea sp. MG754425]MCF6473305.1 TetR/AcrR family transcriptional regulator [Nonomuraea sp. MG754425]
MDNVWLRSPKDPKPRLTLERIVTEAVALLDEEGVGKLTMRHLAERLDTGSTTLYWHVKTKEDVLDLALDAVFHEVALPGREGDWRAAVRNLMAGWRAALLRHPWSATILDRPLMGPNALARTESLYRILVAAGFPDPQAAHSLSNYVMGSVTMQVTWQEREHLDMGAFLRERADRYPALAEHGLHHDWDATFAKGLSYLIRGMEHDLGRPG